MKLIFSNLAIIIVNFNQPEHTFECIDSLLNAQAKISQITVVDNASQDGSVSLLKEQYGPDLTVLALKQNKGYPYALNKGIPNAINKETDWFLLMNNDVVVDDDFLLELKRATIEQPKAALIGPTILYYDHPEIIWYIGYKIIPGTLIGIKSFRGKKFNNKIPNYVPIDVMHGCTMMVNKQVFDEIGFFDDSNLIYGDDADFSLRAREAGFDMVAATRAKMWHKISLTMGKEKPIRRYLRTRNTIAFYKKYSRGIKRMIMFFFTLFKGLITLIEDIASGNLFLIRPLVFGIVDGWKSPNYAQREF